MAVNLKIVAENLGPHSNLSGEISTGNCRAVIYANNGSGKTFLSRAFRVFEQNYSNPIDHLISFEKQSAKFEFNIINGQSKFTSTFGLRKGIAPSIINPSGYIYHVFNSDYVKENVALNNFSPNRNIDGYILGKKTIDLSKEKKKLGELNKQIGIKVESLKVDKIPKAIKVLDGIGINKNTTEYKALNYDNLLKGFSYNENNSLQGLKEEFNKLKSFDTTIPDLKHFSNGNIDGKFYGILSQIQELLLKKVSTSELTEEFKKLIRSKHNFVKDGLNLLGNNKECPFCEQSIAGNAIELIDKYKQFVNDEESKLLDKLQELKEKLSDFGVELRTMVAEYNQITHRFDQIKESIPSLKQVKLRTFNTSGFDKSIEQIQEKIDSKIQNVQEITTEFEITKLESYTFVAEFSELSVAENPKIDKLNRAKNDIKSEQLNLNKRICKSVSLGLAKECSNDINEIKKLNTEIIDLNKQIIELESKEKKSKKEAVANTFIEFLKEFFADKYQFDTKTSCLKYRNEVLQKNADHVLSEGEKSIIAFCYYLAQTHELISKETDYQKIFWIIDDPISSLDFHFVYAMAQIIRGLNDYFNLGDKFRYLIFTHNLEFLSILSRNEICKAIYTLSDSKIAKLNNKLIMPYEEHLVDIYRASKDEKNVKHTTPNSIRHVLETIQRFIAPEKKLLDFYRDIDELKGNSFVYSLMQDLSHGIVRQQKPFTETTISEGCKAVIAYVENNFKGQLTNSVNVN